MRAGEQIRQVVVSTWSVSSKSAIEVVLHTSDSTEFGKS
jgi:hypothetical protein